MKKIAIMTDTNSGITEEKGRQMGVSVLAMPFTINEKHYKEGINLSREAFFKEQEEGAEIYTSMPALGEVKQRWDQLLASYDEVIYIPMSSGLSSSCESAMSMAQEYDGKVYVIDNQRISVPQKSSVEDAIALVRMGKNSEEVKQILERDRLNSDIYISVEDLKYLKKGGRITPAVATIGTILNIRPILQIHGEKLDAYAKVRGSKKAKQCIINALKDSMKRMEVYTPEEVRVQAAYTCNEEEAARWVDELKETFPQFHIEAAPLPLSVACHIGAGAVAAAITKRLPELKHTM